MHLTFLKLALVCSWVASSCSPEPQTGPAPEVVEKALENALRGREALVRSHRYMEAWLARADPETGLIPRRLPATDGLPRTGGDGEDYWNAQDAAADNYPFLVLTAYLTDQDRLRGPLRALLERETRLTTREWGLPDTYSFSKRGFYYDEPDLNRQIFGASEYIKDGLLPVTELMGPSPWSQRMITLLEAIWRVASVSTESGRIPSLNPEVNGEMLQALSRVYSMTGDDRFLEWAQRLGDYYLLGDHHPADQDRLRLRDHGCEIVSGLCELYAVLGSDRPARRELYRRPLHRLLDRILEIGRNRDGLFYNVVNPRTGEVLDQGISDTWGYTYNGIYTVGLIDQKAEYIDSARRTLTNLASGYENYNWEQGSADGFADAIEGALNLYNRERVAGLESWLDREIENMWQLQQPSGIVEGWHGDGNFARTSLMYALWKTQGTRLRPWQPTLRWGAVREGPILWITVSSTTDWQGKILFDRPRHNVYLHLLEDWPRINQFPEWFTVRPSGIYSLARAGGQNLRAVSGAELLFGIDLSLQAGESITLAVQSYESKP